MLILCLFSLHKTIQKSKEILKMNKRLSNVQVLKSNNIFILSRFGIIQQDNTISNELFSTDYITLARMQRGYERTPMIAGQIISKPCIFSSETEFTSLSLAQ